MGAKGLLRQRLRETLAAMTADEHDVGSRRACHRLFDLPEYVRAEVVMVFLSLPTEIDTTPLVLRCWQDRKRVVAPKVSWEQRRMLPVEIQSLSDDLVAGEFGLREPISGVPFPLSMIDLVIVPGLGFDEYGNRLGRGRGFYDRFLASPEFTGVACGLAYEIQVVPNLPVGPTDRPVNLLVTDARIRRFDAAAHQPIPGAATGPKD
ncbi:MAG: 5-formyltetrahydrofolate cyclo-ligase [Phycisphaerae bacterium]|nr:MAG: 5-formyltetrahydrofolate cyclo-ligase [Planctomycetota bacterium]MCK6465156.1 5-formyltetrahydrofolate cyclo-ligase [Phycisphaerae bacterium]MCQ3920007.1 5-formyltetrahydrofolate cyclo-ligase [Planctomycetota bacterium]NUQ07906.1 5-formyltetrahydrofolate cyclo-ligase [Phycisphaerae bacterium]